MDAETDIVHRFLFDDTQIRGEVVTLADSYRQAVAHQDLPIEGQQLLGRFLVAAVLMAETLKIDGTVSLQIKSEAGPVSFAFAEASSDGALRCVLKMREKVSAQGSFFEQDFPAIFDRGILTITIDPEDGDRYQGIVPLEGESLAACLEAYFERSEQIRTRFTIHADEKHAAGLMLQALPLQADDTDQGQAKRAEFDEQWNTALALSDTLSAEELLGDRHDVLLTKLYHELSCRIFPGRSCRFECSCSAERCARAIQSLGAEQAFELLRESAPIRVDCEFCSAHYEFDEPSLERMFAQSS